MNIYRERAHLLALLSIDYPSLIFLPDDAEPGFANGLAIEVGDRLLTWHISDDDMDLFLHLTGDETFAWDGHTTEEKYAHIRDYIRRWDEI